MAGAVAALVALFTFGVEVLYTPAEPQSEATALPTKTAEPTTDPPTTSPTRSPTTSPPSSPPPSPPPKKTPSPVLLVDLQPVDNGTINYKVEAVEVSGDSYPRTLVAFCDEAGSDVHFNLSRDAQDFSVTVGVDDNEADHLVMDVFIYGDEELIHSESVELGKPERIDQLSVEDVLRLKLSCHARTKDPRKHTPFGWVTYADAKLSFQSP
jgi:hypothetical protein